MRTFNNYIGFGSDAQAALEFHKLREDKPELFFGRVVNKMWYAFFGAEDIIKRGCADLPEQLTLICDGVEVPIPKDSQGIIFLNIDSYAGGIPIWSTGTIDGDNISDDGMSSDSESENGRSPSSSLSQGKRNSDARHRNSSAPRYRVDSAEDAKDLMCGDDTLEEILKRRENPSSCQDGMLDIVSIRGCLHLGQINVGLSSASLVCQCREVS